MIRRRGRKHQVVDTNVMVVANRLENESYSCASACARALLDIKQLGVIVIDDRDAILSEYRQNCSIRGQPGVGDSFVRWIHDNRGRADLVQAVPLTVSIERAHDFEEFPRHDGLGGLDPSDRKFVAVANAHPQKPPILQATDSKWWGWREALSHCGIAVEFLCPEEIQATYERKMGAE